MEPPVRVRVGFIRKPVGLAGDLRIDSLTDDPSRFRPGLKVMAGDRAYTLESVRRAGAEITLRLQGLDNLMSVEHLRGQYLEVDAADARPLEEGHFYHWQLVGLAVVDREGRELGVLRDVLEYPANDIYQVEGPAGEILVPALASVVLEVDLSKGRMVVDLPAIDEVAP